MPLRSKLSRGGGLYRTPESSVLFGRLGRMASMAQWLPVALIPKQSLVAFVWCDMIRLRGSSPLAVSAHALQTPGMLGKICPACSLPVRVISTRGR